ncbi:MAG TPA: flagellar basal body P-ring formation protein FlgA [Thermodesulfobacteriaceae bacterium]|nr:flagellar basal body P-ring formation protein FlgA [Thermodesulfobacteriaceae bacterium]
MKVMVKISKVLLFIGLLSLWTFIVLLWAANFSHAKTLEEAYFRKLFREVIAKRLPWPEEDIEIVRLAAEPTPLEVPEGVEEKVHLVGTPGPGSNTLLVDYLLGRRLIARVRVVGYVEVNIPVVVLKRPVARFTVLKPEDLGVERRPLTRLPQDVITDPQEVIGKRVKFGLPAGRPIRRSQVEIPPLIRRNQIVKIVARNAHLTVIVKGQARQDGHMGEIIRVRNLSSKKEIYARVVSSDTVEVSF